jgi:hypothetical protein
MIYSQDDEHPYWYARVIGIYHAKVSFRGQAYKTADVLHVRWLARDSAQKAKNRLPRIGFYDCRLPDADQAFGFVDPYDVIRGVHLIPAFASPEPRTVNLLGQVGPSIARRHNDEKDRSAWDWDWTWFYVNM